MTNLEKYEELFQKEKKLRAKVIKFQNPSDEEERIKITIEREELLFNLTDAELDELNKLHRNYTAS